MFKKLSNINRILLSAGHGGIKNGRYDIGAAFNGHNENEEANRSLASWYLH